MRGDDKQQASESECTTRDDRPDGGQLELRDLRGGQPDPCEEDKQEPGYRAWDWCTAAGHASPPGRSLRSCTDATVRPCGTWLPRVLHSAVTGPDNGEGELKLHGSAVRASQGLRAAATHAWWSGPSGEQAVVFSLPIATALFVEWDIERALMTIHRWSPRGGYSRTTRGYP